MRAYLRYRYEHLHNGATVRYDNEDGTGYIEEPRWFGPMPPTAEAEQLDTLLARAIAAGEHWSRPAAGLRLSTKETAA